MIVKSGKRLKCTRHPQAAIVTMCPSCLGGHKSEAKARASRENGKLGGRPRSERIKGE